MIFIIKDPIYLYSNFHLVFENKYYFKCINTIYCKYIPHYYYYIKLNLIVNSLSYFHEIMEVMITIQRIFIMEKYFHLFDEVNTILIPFYFLALKWINLNWVMTIIYFFQHLHVVSQVSKFTLIVILICVRDSI